MIGDTGLTLVEDERLFCKITDQMSCLRNFDQGVGIHLSRKSTVSRRAERILPPSDGAEMHFGDIRFFVDCGSTRHNLMRSITYLTEGTSADNLVPIKKSECANSDL